MPPSRLRDLGKESRGISSRFGSQKKSPRCMSLRHGELAVTWSKAQLGEEESKDAPVRT